MTEVLALVGLAGFEDRSIDTLSGGEAQRVALARSLAPAPRLLMLDEPLGSLDRTLRDRLAVDLRRVLAALGTAAVHVTHDQEEAYAVADRLVVMRQGRVVRDGPAAEVWREPGTEFVARFLGHEDVLDGRTALALGLGDGDHPVVVREAAIGVEQRHGPTGTLPLVRPADGGATVFDATVGSVRFRGATSAVSLRLATADGTPVALTVHAADPPPVGAAVRVRIDPAHVTPLKA